LKNWYFWSVVMSKTFRLALILVVFAIVPVWAESKPRGPVVVPLDQRMEDVGCVYYERKSGKTAFPIFLSTVDGTWMNIDGEKRQLTQLDSDNDNDSGQYMAGDYRIVLAYGKAKELEGGVNYGRVTITVQKQNRSTVIKAKGSCGC
jgi:hypothetical protein